MPPKPGEIALTTDTISSTSWVARQIGKASTPPNSLKSIDLPSITGSAASGPMSPRPSTAEPSVTTATMCCLVVSAQTFCGSSAIALETRATPGVYAIERSSRVLIGARGTTSILPRRCIRNVRSETCSDLDAVDMLDGGHDGFEMRRVRTQHCDVANLRQPFDADDVDRAQRSTSLADRGCEPRERAGTVVEPDANGRAEGGGGMHAGYGRTGFIVRHGEKLRAWT